MPGEGKRRESYSTVNVGAIFLAMKGKGAVSRQVEEKKELQLTLKGVRRRRVASQKEGGHAAPSKGRAPGGYAEVKILILSYGEEIRLRNCCGRGKEKSTRLTVQGRK